MPGYDQTGPVGKGPMTGWRRGTCGNPQDTYLPNGNFGLQGVGRGGTPRGGGRGRCGGLGPNRPRSLPLEDAVSTPQDNNDKLMNELSEARREIEALKARINELSNNA